MREPSWPAFDRFEISGVTQETKIFQYCTCPAGQVTYNFHWSCKHMYLSSKSVCYKEHRGIICYMTYIVPNITVIFPQLNS